MSYSSEVLSDTNNEEGRGAEASRATGSPTGVGVEAARPFLQIRLELVE
jgi:hypothetical protein